MMAVPFALPEDDINNLITAVIFLLSQTRLERNEDNHELQECMEELIRLLMEELERRSRSSEYDNHLRQTLFLLRQSLNQLTPTPSRISSRRRTDSSCCVTDDNNKISINEDDSREDCTQVGHILGKIADDDTSATFKGEFRGEKNSLVSESPSFLWRLVSGVRRTFWQAVPLVCMMGWHLFQTHNCM